MVVESGQLGEAMMANEAIHEPDSPDKTSLDAETINENNQDVESEGDSEASTAQDDKLPGLIRSFIGDRIAVETKGHGVVFQDFTVNGAGVGVSCRSCFTIDDRASRPSVLIANWSTQARFG